MTRRRPPDLTVRTERERLSEPALRAFFNIMAHWKVRDEDARTLLGGVSNGPFYEMKRNPTARSSRGLVILTPQWPMDGVLPRTSARGTLQRP